MTEAAAIFVHGILSSPETWSPLTSLLASDPEINSLYSMIPFGYSSPRFNWRPDKRIPDYNIIADSLATIIEHECADKSSLVLIGHSQGGLIIQRYLSRMLADARGHELKKIRRVILIACPNDGSEFLLMARKALRFVMHRQEKQLRPLQDAVTEARRRVFHGIIRATEVSPGSCPIPFAVFAAEEDNIVTPTSAQSIFSRAGALPGDHNTVIRPDASDSRIFTVMKSLLLAAVGFSQIHAPSSASSSAGLSPPSRNTSGNSPPSQPPAPRQPRPCMRVTRQRVVNGMVEEIHEFEIFSRSLADSYIVKFSTDGVTGAEEVA